MYEVVCKNLLQDFLKINIKKQDRVQVIDIIN